MTNKAYQRSDAFEKRVMHELEADGYAVWQSRGSKGAADIVAAKPHELLVVQVKSGEARISHDGWNALLELALRSGAVPILAIRSGRHILYQRLTAKHDFYGHTWPSEPWTPNYLMGNGHGSSS